MLILVIQSIPEHINVHLGTAVLVCLTRIHFSLPPAPYQQCKVGIQWHSFLTKQYC